MNLFKTLEFIAFSLCSLDCARDGKYIAVMKS